MADGLDGEMINKTKPYNKSTGIQGIGDTVKLMDWDDMNELNDPIVPDSTHKTHPDNSVGKYSKNS